MNPQKVGVLGIVFISLMVARVAVAQPAPSTTPHPEEYWKQPDVGCVEDLYNAPEGSGVCPDLTTAEITMDDLGRTFDGNCAAQEIVRRETATRGSQPLMKWAWLMIHSVKDRDQKLQYIEEAAKKLTMPPQFLYAVLNMESIVTDLPVTLDYGNYSCGAGSFNITGWCNWISTQTPEFQKTLGWPVGISCDHSVNREIVGALYDQAYPNTDLPYEELVDDAAKRFEAVSDEAILAKLDVKKDEETRKQQLQAIRSFSRNCQNPKYAIETTAFMLKNSFDHLVPKELREQEVYPPGETFNRVCKNAYSSPYYPLHSGWLLTYGIHNMGEQAAELFKFYYGANLPELHLHPQDIVHALYWGGKVNAEKPEKIDYVDSKGAPQEVPAQLACNAHANIVYMSKSMAHPTPLVLEENSDCSKMTNTRKLSSGLFIAGFSDDPTRASYQNKALPRLIK